ncbi:MAG: Wzz/FepE/Etk N-terminal domain-containing protein [Clostridia bacterium]|nr:Wzz/FepE/Etk N-terminal domain-containing protein [Clostridia bacterium]
MNVRKVMDLNQMLIALKARAYIWLISILICMTVATYYVMYRMDPVFVASTTIFVSNDSPQADETTMTNIAIAEKMLSDCQVIATSNRVLDAVRQKLPADVRIDPSKISISLMEDSRIMKLTVKSSNASHAASIANAITDVLIVEARELTKIENIQPVDRANIPPAPDSSSARNYLLIAFAIGVALGVGIVFILEIFDKTIHGPDDIGDHYGLPILALIPQITQNDVKEKGDFPDE